MKIIIGPTSEKLALRTVELADCEKVQVINKRFPDGEVYVRLEGNVKNEDVVIIQTTSPPQNISLIQLAFISNSAKLAGAKKIIGIVPYLAYSRQDKMFLQGENISIDTIASMLKAAGINELITINIHQKKVLERFSFVAKTLSAVPLLAKYFKQQV